MKRGPAKRKRNDYTECSNMERTTSGGGHTAASEKDRLTDSDYRLQSNVGQPKKVKFQ